MRIDPVLTHARDLWEELAHAPISFARAAGGVTVVVSPESRLCPPGWVGVVLLGDSAIVTAPNQSTAAQLSGLTVESLMTPDLPAADILGPATLSYLSPDDFRPTQTHVRIHELPAGSPELRKLDESAGDADAGEAALDEITSPAFAIYANDEVIAAAGYRLWPRRTAHLSVLTSPSWRGQGLARAAASSAVAHALDAGLLPQWRARPVESRRVAASLGFRELGTQLSFRLS